MKTNLIIHRSNYVIRDTHPTTGIVEFNRVNATIMELELLRRYFRKNEMSYSFYSSRIKDAPSKKNSVLTFEQFLSRRGLGFVSGYLERIGEPEIGNGNSILYTMIFIMLVCLVTAFLV